VAIRALNIGIEPSPLEKLGEVYRLFQKAAETSSPALRALVSIIELTIQEGQLTGYFPQPRLLMLRQKALRLCQSNLENAKPNYLHGKPYNELATLGEQIGLVMPKHQAVAPDEPLSGIYGPGMNRDNAVGPANPEGVLEDKWSSDMCQDLAQDVIMGEA
jgi:hypothetical protein